MNDGLKIPREGELDFLSLGALVHRLDPGIVPFRKATECQIHVSGGELMSLLIWLTASACGPG